MSLGDVDNLNAPHTAYAPASGAVIALVKPAENNPIAKNSVAKSPSNGVNCRAKLSALAAKPWAKKVLAAVPKIAIVINPPIEKLMTFLIRFSLICGSR